MQVAAQEYFDSRNESPRSLARSSGTCRAWSKASTDVSECQRLRFKVVDALIAQVVSQHCNLRLSARIDAK
jgi:hypothetical protein